MAILASGHHRAQAGDGYGERTCLDLDRPHKRRRLEDSDEEADDDRRDPRVEHQRTPGLDLAEQRQGLRDDDLVEQRLAADRA